MKLIICLDDKDGVLFNHRRLSMDAVLMKDVVELCAEQVIYGSEYTAKMFEKCELQQFIEVSDIETIRDKEQMPELESNELEVNELEVTQVQEQEQDKEQDNNKDCYYFCEGDEFEQASDIVQEYIIYKWNRRYPSDLKFDRRLLEGMSLCESKDFAGSSHEKITREIYRKSI